MGWDSVGFVKHRNHGSPTVCVCPDEDAKQYMKDYIDIWCAMGNIDPASVNIPVFTLTEYLTLQNAKLLQTVLNKYLGEDLASMGASSYTNWLAELSQLPADVLYAKYRMDPDTLTSIIEAYGLRIVVEPSGSAFATPDGTGASTYWSNFDRSNQLFNPDGSDNTAGFLTLWGILYASQTVDNGRITIANTQQFWKDSGYQGTMPFESDKWEIVLNSGVPSWGDSLKNAFEGHWGPNSLEEYIP